MRLRWRVHSVSAAGLVRRRRPTASATTSIYVGELDACGVCSDIGCSDIPEGDCDCDGNVLDECGVCGGDGIPAGTATAMRA